MDNLDQFEGIAIVGMAGRFPGAQSVSEFWENLATGTESISFFSDEQLLRSGVDASLLTRPDYVRAAGVLADADLFDAGLFGINPREAEVLDPQQRVFLETAWQALEDAAYDSERYPGAIGVYAGVSLNSYFLHNVSGNREVLGKVGEFQALLVSDKDFLPTRVSYKLNLRGPSVTVQTACSTSLVAVHIACQALLSGECDMALAGGVSVSVPQESGYVYQEGGIASPDGHCRAFDAAAKGTVGGNGVGVVVLKRLSEAVADGDRIYAVIKGTAINNDGSDKIGYTAPSTNGQAEVIAQGLAIANINPETVTYVEAHGTGTELGDPIEVAALTQVFRASTELQQFCALGSVKTNVGHLDAAAGVTGLIKTALALQHKQLPPSLHFERPNPRIDFAQSPFYVNTELRSWERNGTPRRAGVSSFGIGGTNAHAVLEEAPEPVETSEPVREWQLLPLSARSETALEAMSEQLAQHLLAHPEQQLADVAHTLQIGRRVLPHKRAVLCRSGAEAVEALERRDWRVLNGVQELKARPVVLMFPGQGAQYAGMGAELYERETVYRRELDRCDEILRRELGLSLVQLLYKTDAEEAAQQLEQTRVTQPALFAVEYALARQLLHWGVKVEGMIGHSVGEYVAACLAGVFPLEQALRLVVLRGRLMQSMAPGVMLSVGLSEEEVQQRLKPGLSLAAVNGAQLCVVSGTGTAVNELEQELTAAGVWSRRLRTSHAFHSEMMEPAVVQFVNEVRRQELRAPQMRFISNLSGTWINAEEATSAEYWGRQLRETVRFRAGLSAVLQEGGKLLLEVGPGRGLSTLAREAMQGVAGAAVVRTMKSAEEEGEAQQWLQRAVGQLWVQGGQVSWEQLRETEVRRRESVPGYVFERERFWIERTVNTDEQSNEVVKRPDIADWFYLPSWKRSRPSSFLKRSEPNLEQRWLIFMDEQGVGEQLTAQLPQAITVRAGEEFIRHSETSFTIDPQSPAHYRELLGATQLPERVVHLWGVDPAQGFEQAQSRGLYSLLYLAQALSATGVDHEVELAVVTTQTQEVSGDEQLCAEKATVLGACKVIPQEHSRIRCRAVDVELGDAQRLAEQLITELSEPSKSRVIAYRGAHRWEQSFERVRVTGNESRRLRNGGVYLITGGFGGVGQSLAQYLAAEVGAKLVLVSRNGAEGRPGAVEKLEELGAEVLVVRADVSDERAMQAAVQQARARFGDLHGVVHAAGLAGVRAMTAIQEMTAADCESHFRAKVKGLLVLESVLKDQPLDFAIVTSSLASVLGGLGFFAYASSNIFIDTYAHFSSLRWTSVNWDGWNFSREGHQPSLGPGVAALAMTPAEGAEAFARILSLDAAPQIIVSTANLDARLAQWVNTSATEADTKAKSATAGHSRPDLKTTFSAPRNDLEATILRVWQELLGIEQIGIYDNFFELGGHSLLATQVISHLRTVLRVEVPVRSIFEKPTVAELAESIAAFTGQTEDPKPAAATQFIARRDDSAPAPLSFAQQRLWFFQQLEPASTAYNYPKAVRFKGEFDIAVLERSLNEVVQRHEMLRTTFHVADGKPIQVISPFSPLPLPVIDLQGEPFVEPFIEDESRKPFDLEAGPLVRFSLLRLSGEEHILLMIMHHIITDAWSLGVLIHEVAALYEAYSSGKTSPLGELRIQYADYAVWQREWLQGDVYAQQLDYWRKQLAGSPPVLELSADRPRPLLQTTNGAYHWFEIDAEIVQSLKSLSHAEGATLFMTLLAAFKVLLSRYTGQQDIVIGTPVANRNQEEIESLIGFFVNTLVLRTDLSGGPSFREAVQREREVCLGAYTHQDLPFEKLVEELQPQRDLSHTPLFQVMFLLENASLVESHSGVGSLAFTPVEIISRTSKFDLTLGFTEVGTGLAGAFEYNTDLFEAATIAEMATQLTTLLRAAVAEPDVAVTRLPLLTAPERRRVLQQPNQTAQEYPATLIHELIEAQAVLNGELPALQFEGETLSYAELNRRANQLAHHLRGRGVGPETVVGLSLERSLELVISIVATLKAGGAYMPLDPSYPQERLRYMVANAGCQVVLTKAELGEQLAGLAELLVVNLDQEAAALAKESTQNPVSGVDESNSAYVIYTSGSTGQPKGVVNTHGGLRNRLQWMQQQYGLSSTDAVLQKTPFSFDVSVWEFLWPLMMGARLVVARPGGHQDSGYLVELIRSHGVTVMHFVPSMLRVFLQEAEAHTCASLRLVVCSGEALPAELVREFYARLSETKLENLYGPTEAAIDVSYWSCPREGELLSVPIGRPIANTELYVLDEQLEPVPVGVSGEIYIGGVGLARGYVSQPGLTAERFIPHPFAGDGARLYRTGDVGRWNRQGELEYLGRGDTQVKVRGFRIELGEIEAAVARQPEVAECVVEVRAGRGGDQRLVCYLVLAAGAQLQVSGLREQLREQLPEYMVPGVFVELAELPLSAHGKLDRKRLPEPEGERPELALAYEEPRSELEREIAQVWAEVLGVQRVGAYDNFFDLGGHSLLLVEAQRKLVERGVGAVSVVEMFQYPTVNTLARRMSGGHDDEKQKALKSEQRRLVDKSDNVAIIGMAGRFPGAQSVSEFWENLATGTESISFFSDEQLLRSGVEASLLARADYVRAAGVLADADLFDAGLFGINPREAEVLDPQQRVFLETAWQALEDAAYDSERYPGAIGVYAGVSLNSYFLHNVSGNREVLGQVGGFQALLGSDKDFLPTRVSYKLNLRGPSVTVQTACSTSLVAVHIACQALLSGECDMALAGGVSVSVPQESGYVYQEGGIASPDGHCRAFDAAAKGTVGGNGVGVVVLKRLSEAVADGDRIYAVIKGTAINNDGSDKIGYTAPSLDGQSKAIARAQAEAEVDPHTIGYVEAHGTGTELGDPIEVAALTQVFRASTELQQFCALGSVKSNVGHLDAAAGVTGLIKTALALQHKQLPPSLHFEQPNPRIDFAQSPFYVNTELRPWERNGTPRRAGVSSFGIGGTNAHAVLEEAPERVETSEPVREWQLLPLSARSETALEAMSEQLAQHLLAHPEQQLADVAHTLQIGRRVLPHKRAVLCRSAAEAVEALERRDWRVLNGVQELKARPVVLMFPGQGAQYAGMGAELYEREAVYRRELDRCDEVLRGELGFSLAQLLYKTEAEEAATQLEQTRVTQAALFAVEYALARQLLHWGVKVEGMIGHSVGEYVAACLAGVFPLEQALRLVALRGRLMQSMAPGVMLSVGLSEEEVQQRLKPGLSLAAVNGAQLCVVSGTGTAVSELEQELTAAGVWSRRLRTSHAFHSEMMEPAVAQFVKEVRRQELRTPQMRFISNLSGTWINAEEATSAEYWGRQLRETVRFRAGLSAVLQEGGKLLLEVGPGRGLSTLAREAMQGVAGAAVVRTMKSAEEEGEAQQWLQRAVGQLWVQGGQVSWEQLRETEVRRRESVPGYVFERERYWIERTVTPVEETPKREPDIADWFYVPSWKQAPLGMDFDADAFAENQGNWLLFVDEQGVGEQLAAQLPQAITVRAGEEFARHSETSFTIDPRSSAHYRGLLRATRLPDKVVHLWNVSDGEQDFEETQSRGLYSLLYLTQALAEAGLDHAVDLQVVTTQTQSVTGTEDLRADKATLLGACKVIPQEHSRIRCRTIDVELNSKQVVEQLLAEISEQRGQAPLPDLLGIEQRVIAYRGAYRWEQSFERVRVTEGRKRRLRSGGVYLITGGFGGVGQSLAEFLAAEARAKLVLVSRNGAEGEGRAAAIKRLEESGAEVLVVRADVSDEPAMRAAVQQARERFGQLHGVVHAAGVAGGAIIERFTPELAQVTFDAKIKGTQVLDRVLRDIDLDFMLLCSSHRSILGGLGRVDYAAANSFLDAYAQANNNRRGYVVSVNWDTWRDAGMAVDAARQQNLDPAHAIQEGLYAAEGVEVFKRILSSRLPQVIVSPEDFQRRVRESERLSADKMLQELEQQTGATETTLHERPELSSSYVEPRNETERKLAAIWEKILGIAPIGIHDNYLELGGDSVLTIQIIARANQAGLKLSPRQMFEHQTIEALAAVAGTTAELKAEQGLVHGPVLLTPIQHWFFEQEIEDAHHYNQAVMLELRQTISADTLRHVVEKVLQHHDALRMRFKRADGWEQENATREDADVFTVVNLSETPADQQRAAIETDAQEVQKQLDLEHGPVVRVVLYELGNGKASRLLIVLHHLVVDAVSWRILIEDLQKGCEQFKRGEALDFGAKTTSYKEWAESLTRLAREGAVDDELRYWTTPARAAVGSMPVDGLEGVNSAGSVAVVSVSLDEEETNSLLQQVGKAYNTSVEEALLTALKEAYEQWSGQERLLVDVEGHGREEFEDGIDVTRTVGWFTSIYPVLLDQQPDGHIGARLAAVKEELRQVKRSGLGYGLLRYLSPEAERLKELPEAEIIFLYLGQLDRVIDEDGAFTVATESAGQSRSATGNRKHKLEISSAVSGGKLEVSWNYSANLHSRETIEKLALDHLDFLRELIAHCQSPNERGYTPSDFPEVNLSQAELDALIAKLG